MKFQNPIIHCSKVSNFTKKWENQSKFKNSVFLSSSQKLIRSSTHQPQPVTYYSRYLAHKIFKFCFQREITQKKAYNSDKKKIRVNYFFMRNTHMKFQLHDMLHSKVNTHTHTHTRTHTHTDRQTDRQTIQKQYALPTFSKLGA